MLVTLKTRNLNTLEGPLITWTTHLIKDFSSLFHRRGRKVVEEKDDEVKTKNHIMASHDAPLSTEVILREDEAASLHTRLAKEILKNGIECKASPDIGSLSIERKPYYSYFFPFSPRIVTNRGCIRIDTNGERNIDIMQVIQRN